MEGQYRDVAVKQAALADGLADPGTVLPYLHLSDPVAGAHRKALANVEFGERHLVVDEVDHRPRDVAPRGLLDALEARRGVDLHHQRAMV